MKDLMIDIETLGTSHNAAVIAIGAVVFDPLTGQTGTQFYRKVLPNDARLFGEASADTMKWWAKQDPATREEAFTGGAPSREVAATFSEFVEVCARGGKVWGNGATFDITILESLFAAHSLPVPWSFWNVRDVRTVVDLGERLRGSQAKKAPFKGMAHKALDDALHQAAYVSAIVQELRGPNV